MGRKASGELFDGLWSIGVKRLENPLARGGQLRGRVRGVGDGRAKCATEIVTRQYWPAIGRELGEPNWTAVYRRYQRLERRFGEAQSPNEEA